MNTETKTDTLHLYLGCWGIVSDSKVPEYEDGKWVLSCDVLKHALLGNLTFTPVLRPLEDMTDEERKDLWQLVFNRPFGKNGDVRWFDEKEAVPGRYVLMSGVERLGIEMNGNIWADSDLSNYKYNRHEVTRWLLLKHFDLFGLIEAGLAIDKTKQTTL